MLMDYQAQRSIWLMTCIAAIDLYILLVVAHGWLSTTTLLTYIY